MEESVGIKNTSDPDGYIDMSIDITNEIISYTPTRHTKPSSTRLLRSVENDERVSHGGIPEVNKSLPGTLGAASEASGKSWELASKQTDELRIVSNAIPGKSSTEDAESHGTSCIRMEVAPVMQEVTSQTSDESSNDPSTVIKPREVATVAPIGPRIDPVTAYKSPEVEHVVPEELCIVSEEVPEHSLASDSEAPVEFPTSSEVVHEIACVTLLDLPDIASKQPDELCTVSNVLSEQPAVADPEETGDSCTSSELVPVVQEITSVTPDESRIDGVMAPKAPVVSEELCIVTEVAPEQSSAKDSDAPGEYPIGCEVFREVLEHPTDRDTEALRVDSGQIEESTKRPQRQSTKNPPDPSTDLDETIGGQCSKGSQIMKSCPVEEDERNGMFPTDIIGITRGKGGKLGVEVITHGIYKYKCGFRTDRPVRWADALETIVTNGRWDYTLNENQYTVCVIKVPFSAGIVNVEITLTTGLICVSGTNYETWISSIFEPWRSLTVDGIAKPIEPFSDQTNDEEAKDPKGEVEERDIRNDVERLWEEHRTLKTAFSTLESTVNIL